MHAERVHQAPGNLPKRQALMVLQAAPRTAVHERRHHDQEGANPWGSTTGQAPAHMKRERIVLYVVLAFVTITTPLMGILLITVCVILVPFTDWLGKRKSDHL